MEFTLITGDHIRHLYLADYLCRKGYKINWIIEKRENQVPSANKNLTKDLKILFKKHFLRREIAEKKFFGKNSGQLAKKKIKNKFIIKPFNYNQNTLKILENFKNKNLLTYGCSILNDDILKLFKGYKWNIHAGLSPKYRGAATHFWPSFFLEPEYTGMTLHTLSSRIDGGNIFHQTSIKLNKNYGIHDNSCQAVKEFIFDLPKVINFVSKSHKKILGIKQRNKGILWTQKMWKTSTLNFIYDVHKDKINQYCIRNKIIKKPKLLSILNTSI